MAISEAQKSPISLKLELADLLEGGLFPYLTEHFKIKNPSILIIIKQLL